MQGNAFSPVDTAFEALRPYLRYGTLDQEQDIYAALETLYRAGLDTPDAGVATAKAVLDYDHDAGLPR